MSIENKTEINVNNRTGNRKNLPMPNYQPSPCCENCYHGYDRLVEGTKNCSLHCTLEVDRRYVCDDWRPIGWKPGWGTVWNGKPPYTLATASTHALITELVSREGVARYDVGVEDRYLVRVYSEHKTDNEEGTDTKSGLGPAIILVVVD